MEDSVIVELYWQRSQRAISETNLKYGYMLQSISFSLLSSRQDAEECVNDTYMSAWNRMPDERPTFLGAFLAKIVRCVSIDRFRKNTRLKRGGASVLLDELEECVPDTRDVESELEKGMLTDTLNRFVNSLDAEKRAMFVLRYFHCRETASIAKQLGISDSKVKTTLFRLRALLRDTLEKEGLL